MHKIIDSVLNKEMDRREFLKFVGLGAMSIVGLGALRDILFVSNKPSRARGYGSSNYGGIEPSRQNAKKVYTQ